MVWFGVFFLFLYFRSYFFITANKGLEFDQTLFQTVANQLLHGRTLYNDIWASKPPMIYVVGMINHYLPYRILEFLLGVLTVFNIVSIAGNWLKKWWQVLAVLILFLTLFYNGLLYGRGGYTEEYGLQFLILSITFLLKFHQNEQKKQLLFAGIFAATATLFKEPFVFSIIPWWLFLVFTYNFKKWIPFVWGGLLGLLPFTFYLLFTGGVGGFLKYINYTSAYSKFLDLNLMQKLSIGLNKYLQIFEPIGSFAAFLPLLIFFAFLLPSTNKKLCLVIASQFVVELLSCCVSGYTFGHYFLQMIFSYSIVSVVGVVSLTEFLQQRRFPFVNTALLIFAVVFSYQNLNSFQQNGSKENPTLLAKPFEKTIEKYIPTGASVYIDDPDLASFYLRNKYYTNSYIPIPVFHFFVIQDDYAQVRFNIFKKTLIERPNQFIIQSSETLGLTNKYKDIKAFLLEKYEKIYDSKIENKGLIIWRLK
ncbi:MAG: glycosyltransferase family 39 protein [Flavobacteriales bacterium]|nr:glycosyltransferase family 39 protein [Flavobacteriales bacterium]